MLLSSANAEAELGPIWRQVMIEAGYAANELNLAIPGPPCEGDKSEPCPLRTPEALALASTILPGAHTKRAAQADTRAASKACFLSAGQ